MQIGDLVKINDSACCYFTAEDGYTEVYGYQFENSLGVITSISGYQAEVFIDNENVLVSIVELERGHTC